MNHQPSTIIREIDRQLDILTARSVDLVSRAELRRKLETAAAAKRPLRVKYGADPSAPDIHLGHVVGLNKLREFQDLGHTVVFIIGDFTGMIGDPSGRSETRKPMSPEQIAANAKTYQDQVFKVLDRSRTEVRFNSEWCAGLAFPDVLRLTAHVTVAQMLARDDFQKRFKDNQPISVVEFLYPVIQGYDSVQVDADIEVGGTDQLFNLLVGRDLQKAFGKEPQVVLTLPLLEGLDGIRKMSKSLSNYVGITESPREMFGKIMSIPDALMERYFTLVLGRPDNETKALEQAVASGKRHPRQVKDELAQAIVARFHSPAAALAASAEFERVFSEHKQPDEIPTIVIPMTQRKNSKLGVMALLVAAGLAESNGAARRLIQQGAVKIGETKITDIATELAIPEGCIIQAGKRAFARIVSQQ
ncbi:MAG: tyrosine--tRNA ligase [Verrucomicrobia bacterium]|nr:tyrosine--tRNA ligase [Verrucomicrobiota bacterium]MBU1734813.1 tyrosine--tRNA ligase [Verrucomicrobiota bacterium]MBU1858173.1 tyrosine--tRNA ligase [Verrucomicrobiota bacterium]